MNIKIYFLPIFIFLVIYVNSGFSQIVNLSYKNFTVSGNKEISGELTIKERVNVKKGATLIIKGNLLMMPQAKFIVERGGKLIIDGGKVTSQDTILWEGIEVWGTASALQNPVEQGWVRVINGGTIENAICGIRAVKMDNTIPPPGDATPNYNYTGGIIEATDAYFINNQTAIRFYDYHYLSVSGFNNCEFKVDQNYIGSEQPENYMIIDNMTGIDITYCKFINETLTSHQYTGILSENSIIRVEGKCIAGSSCTDWENGEFINLDYGIYATAYTPQQYVDIRHTTFENNYRGVYISGMSNAVATENNFEVNTDFVTGGGYGLYLDHSTGYKVEDNNFYHDQHSPTGVGLVVNQSGEEPNQIYRNYFTFLECGMDIQGENRANDSTGLVLKCNEYDSTLMDKIITWNLPKVTYNAGIASHQGASSSNPEDMAGNLFQNDGPPNDDYDDILNEANNITYFHPDEYDDIRVVPVDYTQNTVTLEDVYFSPLDPWTYKDGCPPSDDPGGGGIGTTKGKMASAGYKIDSTENLLAMLIDGGDTETTQTDVDNSIPPETMQVYNDLMNKSPYLSDTVVSTAIEKEDVLPGTMIRDIMVANPNTAKSEKLMNKLDERWYPLPEYMIAQIMAGRSIVSIREETESRLAAYKQEKAKHFNTLVRYYLIDTLDPQASLDSLIILLQNENSLTAKYKLAMMSVERGAWSEGLSVLNNIPTQFELNSAETNAHTQFTNYYSLIANIAQQGKSVFEADSTQIVNLAVIEATQSGQASVYARNILLALEKMEYEEPIILPDILKSAIAQIEYNELLSKADNASGLIKVKPNPAKDYIIISYELEKDENITIEINDITGNLKYSDNFINRQDEFTVDTRNWKTGVYIVSLKISGKLIESFKFTVID